MSFGITAAGWVKKTYDDIKGELDLQAQSLFGADVDLTEYSPVGIFIRMMADQLEDTWDGFEDDYYSHYVDTAEGVSLDRVTALGGITRRAATKAIVPVHFFGTPGSNVPLGSLIQTAQTIQFETYASGVVAISGLIDIMSRAVLAGSESIVPSGTIVQLTNPIPGITSCVNYTPSSGGYEIEDDPDLRARYKDFEIFSGSSVPAITNAMLQVTNVNSVYVYENNTDSVDVDGRPAHSIEIVVAGSATDEDIANGIWNSKPAGIATFGSQNYDVEDSEGNLHTVYWNEASDVLINVILNVTTGTGWVAGNITTLKTKTVEHIGGVDTIGSIATEYIGLGVGEDVKAWVIATNFDNISGIEDIEILIAKSPTVPIAATKLVLAASENARCDTANVTVNTI